MARSLVVDESFSETANEGENLVFFASTAVAINPGDEWVFGADAPVTAESHEQYGPAVSGDLAVWVDYRPAANGSTMGRIYYRHLDQNEPDGQPLTEARGDLGQPAVSGNLVVWSEYVYPVGNQVFFMHIGDTAPTRLSPTQTGQGQPSVYGTKIVWADSRSGEADIYLKDIDTGVEQVICTDPDDQGSPTIFSDWVAWVDRGAPGYQGHTRNDIFAKNMSTGEVFQVTWDGNSVMQGGPVLGGDIKGRILYQYAVLDWLLR